MGIQETLKALSDPVRRRILEYLKTGNKSAGDIAGLFDISAPAISRHLSVLKDAGLVRDYRQGKHIFYELKASVLEETLLWITTLKDGQYKEEFDTYRDPVSGQRGDHGSIPGCSS